MPSAWNPSAARSPFALSSRESVADEGWRLDDLADRALSGPTGADQAAGLERLSHRVPATEAGEAKVSEVIRAALRDLDDGVHIRTEPRPMTSHPTRHDAQRAAYFLVAGQLALRGYQLVATAASDESVLTVESPAGMALAVAVHGIGREHAAWVVKPGTRLAPVLHVAVLAVPSPGHARYFILTPDEVAAAIKPLASPPRGALGGFHPSDVAEHEDRWEKLAH